MQQPRFGAEPTESCCAAPTPPCAAEHAGAQLHLVGLDAVGGGEPAEDTEPDRHAERSHRPYRVAGRRTQHDRADQQRNLPQHLMYGVHQQHSRAEPVPHPLRSGCGHVASSAPIAAMSVSCATTRSATRDVKGDDPHRASRRRRRHRDVGQPEQPVQRAAVRVDGLHARDRRDPALLDQPARPGVHRLRADVPAVHPVAPQRHDDHEHRYARPR